MEERNVKIVRDTRTLRKNNSIILKPSELRGLIKVHGSKIS